MSVVAGVSVVAVSVLRAHSQAVCVAQEGAVQKFQSVNFTTFPGPTTHSPLLCTTKNIDITHVLIMYDLYYSTLYVHVGPRHCRVSCTCVW